MARPSREPATPERITLAEAAAALGLSEDDLAEMVREAGIRLDGPREGWLLDASDVEAVRAEREKRRAQNLRELERLSSLLPEE